jgi:hypothetical protein
LERERESSQKQAAHGDDQEESRAHATEQENAEEVQRVKSEVEATLKRKKVEEVVPLDEVIISKRTKLDAEEEEAPEGDGDENDSDDESEEEEEEWQREAATQLAAEAEEERKKQERENETIEAEADSQKPKDALPLDMPAKVDLSLDEAKALFKVRLWACMGSYSFL